MTTNRGELKHRSVSFNERQYQVGYLSESFNISSQILLFFFSKLVIWWLLSVSGLSRRCWQDLVTANRLHIDNLTSIPVIPQTSTLENSFVNVSSTLTIGQQASERLYKEEEERRKEKIVKVKEERKESFDTIASFFPIVEAVGELSEG